jgi:hypothetical protein
VELPEAVIALDFAFLGTTKASEFPGAVFEATNLESAIV